MPEFSLSTEVEDLFRAKMTEFVAWASANWSITEAEAQTLTKPVANPKDYAEGYNAAIDGMPGALECWLEDFSL